MTPLPPKVDTMMQYHKAFLTTWYLKRFNGEFCFRNFLASYKPFNMLPNFYNHNHITSTILIRTFFSRIIKYH